MLCLLVVSYNAIIQSVVLLGGVFALREALVVTVVLFSLVSCSVVSCICIGWWSELHICAQHSFQIQGRPSRNPLIFCEASNLLASMDLLRIKPDAAGPFDMFLYCEEVLMQGSCNETRPSVGRVFVLC